ncbi:MAG TPA: DMT family transporter [Dongiaceae bacterium]|jgi:drug/metabolite transporter (DMT)-like permease
MSAPARMGPIDWCLLLFLSLLWGASFFYVAVALKELPPFTIVLLRVAIAALTLHIVLRVAGVRFPWDGRSWRAFIGMGLLNNAIPFSLIVWGQTHVASGLASILNATTPFFTVIVAHALTVDERLSKNRLMGVLIGLAGVVVLIGPQALSGLGKDVAGQLAIVGAAISYAFAGVFGRRFRRMGIPPMATAAGQVTASSLLLLPITLLVDRPWHLAMPGTTVWLAILGTALLSTALAYIVYFRLLASAGAVNLLLVTFLIPPSAILLGVFLLGEHLEATDFAGMALIGLGLAAIDGRIALLLPHSRARAS